MWYSRSTSPKKLVTCGVCHLELVGSRMITLPPSPNSRTLAFLSYHFFCRSRALARLVWAISIVCDIVSLNLSTYDTTLSELFDSASLDSLKISSGPRHVWQRAVQIGKTQSIRLALLYMPRASMEANFPARLGHLSLSSITLT